MGNWVFLCFFLMKIEYIYFFWRQKNFSDLVHWIKEIVCEPFRTHPKALEMQKTQEEQVEIEEQVCELFALLVEMCSYCVLEPSRTAAQWWSRSWRVRASILQISKNCKRLVTTLWSLWPSRQWRSSSRSRASARRRLRRSNRWRTSSFPWDSQPYVNSLSGTML